MEARLTTLLRRLALALLGCWLLAAAPVPGSGSARHEQQFERMIAEVNAEMLVDPSKAIASADAALAFAALEPDALRRERMRATAQWLLGEAYGRTGASARALPVLEQARAVAERSPGSQLLADILLSEGAALSDTGQVTKALGALQRAHALYLQLRQPRSRAKALILIALLYDGARDHEAALRYFAQARDAYGADPGLSLAILNGRGLALTELGRFGEAEAAFLRALPVARSMRSDAGTALVLGNLAQARLDQGSYAAAQDAVGAGLTLVRGPGMAPFRPRLIAIDAAIALGRGDVPRAASLIAERFRGVDLGATILADRDAHETAYKVALARGDTALALRHFAALKRLDDQATQIARSNGAALAAARFDYANQELRIAKLKADDLTKTVAFERATAHTQRLIFIGAGAAALILVALLISGVVTLTRSRNKVRAANADLGTANIALEKALAAKTEFLATTSHEIRTPLNGILGMTQVMIADAALDAATRDRLSVVHGAGVTMRALVDDILDVAKIETGKMTIELAPTDLRATIADAARLWRDQAAAKGLAFDVSIDDCPCWIMGDAARLRQIVFNLLSNAVKFTPSGHVSLRAAGRGEGRLRLVVADSGIGIAPEVHEAIFESFRQADAGTTRQFGGTGLGLAICRNLARAMGGDVTVESRLGAGATFTLDLPVVAADAPHAATAAAGTAVLAVEPNPITRAMYRTLFTPLGETAFVDHADAALDWLRTRAAGRVLVDAAALPPADPVPALAAIVAAAGEVPVTLLSPALDAADRARWLATGIAQLVERPVGKKELVSRMERVSRALVPEAA